MEKTNKTIKGGGKKIAQWEDFTIFVTPKQAKRTGKKYVWFGIKQLGKNKKYKIETSLAWTRGADLLFVSK